MKVQDGIIRYLCLFIVCLLIGCSGEAGWNAPSTAPVQKPADSIGICSFNIQVFGSSKSGKPEVMSVLTQIMRRFDVIAVQEFRSKDQSILDQFLAQINSDGSKYDYVVGPRLGRSSSKEQYIYYYDTARISLVPQSAYTVNDPEDQIHREPFVATFRTNTNPIEAGFRFTLVNVHTDPDETKTELDYLGDVFAGIQYSDPTEDDVILLGDLNVDSKTLGKLGLLPGIYPIVQNVPTNTRLTKTYDNLVVDSTKTREFTGSWGVLNLMEEFDLTQEQALKVSDHMPVWAQFQPYEVYTERVAAVPGQ